jgi:hypothetical protein
MMRLIRLLLVVLVLASSLLPASIGGQSRDIVIGPDETCPRSITSWNGRIEIRGVVTDTVLALGGTLVLSGEIRGDLVCIGTTVEIRDKARIQRDVIIIGGTLHRAETSRINGEFFYIRTKEDFKKILSSLLPFLPGTGGLLFFKIIKSVFWLILMLLVLAIFPRRVNEALERFTATWPRCGAVGLLALISFVFLTVLFIVLCFIFIGIPLLLLLFVLYFVLLTFGRTVVTSHLGHLIMKTIRMKSANPVFWLVSGVLVILAFKFIPFAGAALLVGLDIFSIGAALSYFSRSLRHTK